MPALDAGRVVFVNRFFHPDHSATSQMLTDLAFELAARGVRVEVITSRQLYGDQRAQLPKEQIVQGVQVHRIWSTRFGRANLVGRAIDYVSFYLAALAAIWKCTDKDTVVVAMTDPPLISLVAAPVVHLRRGALVNWLQDVFPEVAHVLGLRLVRGLLLTILTRLRNASLRSAYRNVVLGERMAELVAAQGVQPDRVQIIPNWSDGDSVTVVAHPANPLRSAWGLADRFVVGYSGNLGRAHEFRTILDAAASLQAESRIAFLFIGAGAQLREVEAEVRRRQLRNVTFQPYQPRERLHESLGAADVHLVSLNPTLEGLIVPSKFYGIAAAGRATIFIGDADGEIARAVRVGECGYTVSVGDADALATLVRRLAADPGLNAQLGQNARITFERRFDRRLAADAWYDLVAGAPGSLRCVALPARQTDQP